MVVAREPQMTIADRLASARHARFVGRRAELGLFEEALRTGTASFAVLFVHGPAGVGKTALLHAFADRAQAAGTEPVLVDGCSVEPTPSGFLAALDRQAGRPILLVDAYERLELVDSWLRHTLVPQLPGHAIVVIAGRRPPSRRWRSDPGWSDLLRVVPLANLPPEDARAHLAAAGVAARLHDEVVALTDGHPLALALVVEVLARAAGDDLAALQAPDVVRLLREHFVEDVPDAAHRLALDLCALARSTTRRHLRAVVGREDVDDLYDWLRQLAFVREDRRGLHPHDLAREVLTADIRWRDTGRYQTLVRTLLRTAGEDLRGDETAGEALVDLQFTFRTHPRLRGYWHFGSLDEPRPQAPLPSERGAVLDLVRADLGDDQAALADRWLDAQPGGFRVAHGPGGEIVSVVGWLDLSAARPADVAADPIAQRLLRHAAGERVTVGRFLCPSGTAGDRRQLTPSAAHELVRRALGRPRPERDYVVVREPEWWAALLAFCEYEHVDVAAGPGLGVFGHDWRTWPRFLARVLDEHDGRAPTGRPPALAFQAFEAAVRQALRDLHRRAALARNPLVATGLIAGDAEGLAAALAEAARTLTSHPRDEKLHRALDRTYFRPAPTQERAAELLGLPSSTYRRHLAQGVARVVAHLWDGTAR